MTRFKGFIIDRFPPAVILLIVVGLAMLVAMVFAGNGSDPRADHVPPVDSPSQYLAKP
jgi:hypothetical protein